MGKEKQSNSGDNQRGYQPLNEGFQPMEKGFQPNSSNTKPEGSNPPTAQNTIKSNSKEE
jgi:hypothetical protein